MQTVTFHVPGINCGHCVMTIQRTLKSDVGGVADVTGDPERKHVAVTFGPPATIEQVVDAMTELGYPPEPLA